MSTTVVMTMATPATLTTTDSLPSCCPGCGYSLNLTAYEDAQAELLQAQARIADLETQVRLLNQKATAAVDRWADYEDELTQLRAQVSNTSAATTTTSPPASPPARASFLQTGTNRLSALLAPRKSTPNLRPTTAPPAASPPSPAEQDLRAALSREQDLRREAEGKVAATSREVEELSAALFEQANEMVAEERRARAKLEERVGELERRDSEKRRRLERLEGAMRRIERVRELLAEGEEESAVQDSDDGDDGNGNADTVQRAGLDGR